MDDSLCCVAADQLVCNAGTAHEVCALQMKAELPYAMQHKHMLHERCTSCQLDVTVGAILRYLS